MLGKIEDVKRIYVKEARRDCNNQNVNNSQVLTFSR